MYIGPSEYLLGQVLTVLFSVGTVCTAYFFFLVWKILSYVCAVYFTVFVGMKALLYFYPALRSYVSDSTPSTGFGPFPTGFGPLTPGSGPCGSSPCR